MCGFSSVTSCAQSSSASGSLIKVLLQNQLRGDGVYRLVLHAAQAALGFDRAVTLVDPSHRQAEAPLELAREALDASREGMLAVGGDRQPHNQLSGLPLGHQLADAVETGRRNRRQRMRGAELRLPHCYSNTLKTEIE